MKSEAVENVKPQRPRWHKYIARGLRLHDLEFLLSTMEAGRGRFTEREAYVWFFLRDALQWPAKTQEIADAFQWDYGDVLEFVARWDSPFMRRVTVEAQQ